jgi:hypothetical protein
VAAQLRGQPRELLALVGVAVRTGEIAMRIGQPGPPRALAQRPGALLLDQVAAGEVARQVAGREDEPMVGKPEH